ncbi:MAG: FAD-binding oxidoreductase [Candidatus Korobacteraceae bacterium]
MSQAQVQNNDAWTELGAIVGREHLRPASLEDAVEGLQPAGVIAPGSAQEVAHVLRYCNSAGLTIIPRGGGTQLGLGNRLRAADFILSLERLNRVIEHAWGDMTVTVEAGCTIASLQRVLREHGQQLGADPMQPERATVGGVLATAESGTLRIRYGAIRDLVLGLEMALPDGSVIKAGGKVVKNVAGYDLTKLAIGSLGTLGVITSAVFRLHPVPVATATYGAVIPTASEAAKLVLAILDSHLVYTGLQIHASRPDQVFIQVRFEGIPESLQDQSAKLGQIAGDHKFAECADDVWTARQKLFANAGDSVICKCSVLPSQITSLCDAVFRLAESAKIAAVLVAQGTGVAEVRLDAAGLQPLIAVLGALRAEVDRVEGTLTVSLCPVAMKDELDVWGSVNDVLPLMQRIKQKFDPDRTLNPGRFVGGI